MLLGLMIHGCGYPPKTEPLSTLEIEAVETRFKEMLAGQKSCACCLDGVVKVRFDNFFYKGAVSGYLQAMSPSSLKFMALSPLGQPLVVLTSNGKVFQYVDVAAQTVYEGEVTGETFQKYAPAGFSPAFTYYWLTGRLRPGTVSIKVSGRGEVSQRYLLDLIYEDGMRERVLFDPQKMQIYQHLVYDGTGVALEIFYDQYGRKGCGIPLEITVMSLGLNSSLVLTLADLVDKVSLGPTDFTYVVPSHFTRERVQ